MDLGLKGKKAFVTGGTSGIGFAIAQQLLEEGCEVTVASRNSMNIESAIKKLKGGCHGRVIDLGDERTLTDVNADILIINSGGPNSGNPLQLSLEEWDRGYQLLVRSYITLVNQVVPGMKEKGWGRILAITSTSAKQLIPNLPISSTFRAGLSALTKEYGKALGRSGILINNLLPGPTHTDRLKELETKSPLFYQMMEKESALGRVAKPEEIAKVAAFLCSNANSYITGSDVLADGGFTGAL